MTGSSRGLGAEIATKLAEQGASVAINYINNKQGAQGIKETIVKSGGKAEVFRADITEEREVGELFEAIKQTFGVVDILVLNATCNHRHLSIEQLTWDDMLEMMDYFVKSPLLLAKEMVADMKRKKWGRIIHIGSEAFELGIPEFSNYVAAKGAQLGLTRSWASELAGHNITVNLIAPGWIPTDMHRNASEASIREYTAGIPMKHMGEPQDVAAMVACLASEEAKFITGQKIAVNGGNTFI